MHVPIGVKIAKEAVAQHKISILQIGQQELTIAAGELHFRQRGQRIDHRMPIRLAFGTVGLLVGKAYAAGLAPLMAGEQTLAVSQVAQLGPAIKPKFQRLPGLRSG